MKITDTHDRAAQHFDYLDDEESPAMIAPASDGGALPPGRTTDLARFAALSAAASTAGRTYPTIMRRSA